MCGEMTDTLSTSAPVTTGLYIGGEERQTTATLEVVDPGKPGVIVGHAAAASPSAINANAPSSSRLNRRSATDASSTSFIIRTLVIGTLRSTARTSRRMAGARALALESTRMATSIHRRQGFISCVYGM